MILRTGAKLGSYEIIKSLGTGGMGEVYKARDTRLNRAVALKLLLDSSRERPEVRQRFKREAEAIAGLNHPHICTLYDVSEHEGTDFLVMEFVEGETLASRLARGALPLDKAIAYGIEIADALSKAHRQGIVHRDLKPSNIMITGSGVKLLDFGLAKLDPAAQDRIGGELSSLLTRSTPLTGEGVLLGTLQYMAPEQLEGREVDARSDIFALGTILYEMVTGRKAFEANSQASLIGAILHTEPPSIVELQTTVPPALDWTIRVCLAKDPDVRWQTSHDVRLQLQRVRDGGDSGVALAGGRVGRRSWTWPIVVAAAVAALIGGAAIVAALMFREPPPVPGLVSRFGLGVDQGQLLALDVQRAVAMSPDGRRLAYVAARRGKTQVYIRSLDQLEAAPVPGTEGGSDPFFSPDGRWLGFSANSQLKRISLAGGAAIPLSDAPVTFGASWGPDDTIVYAPNPVSGLYRIRADGGKPEAITTLDPGKGELAHRWPHFLPDGKTVLFTVWRGGTFDDGYLAVQRLDGGGERFTVLEGGMDGRYSPTGHLVFARAASLMAVPFDLGRLRTTGPPVPVFGGLETNAVTGAAHFGFSDSGLLAFVPGTTAKYTLVSVDKRGASRALSVPERIFNQPRISPDGRRLTFAVRGVDTDIWVSEIDRGTLTRLTYERGENETPVWSPDGVRVAYSSSRAGQPRTIFSRPADGSGKEEVLRTSRLASHLSSWSRDGVLAFTEFKGTEGDIWVLPVGHGEARPFVETSFNEHGAMFSPDGKWLAYTSDESGEDEVYVRPYPGPGAKTQISTDGGSEPAWARSGTELYYRNDDKLMAVAISPAVKLTAVAPRVLFRGIFENDHRGDTNYDVGSDDQHFILIKSQRQFTRFNVVLNWFQDLVERNSSAR